jgi:hypothetical protein
VAERAVSRFEFWPAWAFYGPLLPWFAWLALRHGSATVFTASNPGIPHGGLLGESKYDILKHLSGPAALPMLRLSPSTVQDNAFEQLTRWMRDSQLHFPIIIKPDVGERGTGVRLLRDATAAQALCEKLRSSPRALIAQAYHPGPAEAGVFYIRYPDKVFPVVVGDGLSPLAKLVTTHPRFSRQAAIFKARVGEAAWQRVPALNEPVALGAVGNHCRGTLFRRGNHLHSPALAAAIDALASSIPGFYFGRFDLRYTNAAELMQGRGFAVVEVNGVSSESTDIYDPSGTYVHALTTLARQWSHACAIGRENITRGAKPSALADLLHAWRIHRARPGADDTSD